MTYYLVRWLALILLGLLVYGQTFWFGFVFDDHIFIVNNSFIKNLDNVPLMWQAFPVTRLVGMYSFALNYYFHQLTPMGYHVFNFAIHVLAAGLVWALANLLFKITKTLPAKDRVVKEIPFIMAVLFLVHPGQTQAVTYITQRFESLATVFYLATIYFYLRGRLAVPARLKILFFGGAGLCTALGVLTKEVTMTIPVMIMAVEWIFFPRKNNKKLLLVLLAGGVVVMYVLFSKMLHTGITSFVKPSPSESHDGDVITPVSYVLTQLRVFLTFLRLLAVPIHQNLEYDYPVSTDLWHPPLTLVGLAVICYMIFLIVRLRRNFPLIAFGLAWMLITFSTNLAPRANVIFEHKLYLVSFGFLLSLTAVLFQWVRDRGTLIRILCCLTAVWGFMAFQRNKVWANELVLWEDTVRKSPQKERVNANLGRIYGSLGRLDESIDYLSRAIALKPDNITYENRGIIYAQKGLVEQALKDLNKSIEMDPPYFPTYVKRAWVFQTQHNYPAALADLARAIELGPYYADAYLARGMLLTEMGRFREALADFEQTLRIDPFNAQAAQYKTLLRNKIVNLLP